jgi:hypothetical protein
VPTPVGHLWDSHPCLPRPDCSTAGQNDLLAPKGAVCKTVGSAYVGSNPTPATTCENAPLAANSRASGAFLLCPGVCHLVALWTVMLRCPRTYSGRPPVRLGRSVCRVTTVGVRSYDGRRAQLRRSVCTVGCFTDGHGRAASAAHSGLTSPARAGSWALRLSLWWDLAAETSVVTTRYGVDSRACT